MSSRETASKGLKKWLMLFKQNPGNNFKRVEAGKMMSKCDVSVCRGRDSYCLEVDRPASSSFGVSLAC